MASKGRKGTTPRQTGPLEEAWSLFDSRHLPYRLLMLGKMLDRLSVQNIRELGGVSLAEWRVLAHLELMGARSASEISAAALVDRAEVSRAVSSMEAAGLLTRVDNPRNRKSSLLVLTPKAHEIYQRVSGQRRDFYGELMADISPNELKLLDELLLRMARQADRIARENSEGAKKKP